MICVAFCSIESKLHDLSMASSTFILPSGYLTSLRKPISRILCVRKKTGDFPYPIFSMAIEIVDLPIENVDFP